MILPAVVSAALVIPNLIVIALGTEDFPFTTAPMFAHYVGPETELFSFRFEGVRDGIAEPLPIQEAGLSGLELNRQLVAWYYRPMTATSPLRDFSGASESPEVFAQRMGTFFGPIADFLRENRDLAYDEIDLYVDVSDREGQVYETELVGRYDPETGRYTHVYQVTP